MDGHEKILIVLIIIAIFYMFVMPSVQSSPTKGGFELPFSFGFLRGKKKKSEPKDPVPNTTKKAAGKQAPPRLPPGNARMTPLPAHLLTDPEIHPAT